MKFLLNCIFLMQILFVSSINKHKIFKCCPSGSELRFINDLELDPQHDRNNYNCVPIEVSPVDPSPTDTTTVDYDDGSTETNLSIESTIDKNSKELFGVNIEHSIDIRIPECSDVEIFKFDFDGGLISSDGCVDEIDGVLYGFKCSDKLQVEVHKLFKCCPEGYSYEIQERQCVRSNLTDSITFEHFLGNAVAVFSNKVPNCSSEEVFVEYQTNLHKFVLSRSGVKIFVEPDQEDYLQPHSFCIEGIVDLNQSKNNKIFMQSTHPIIIRSCRNNKICKRIPCVRRCCKNEQMFERQNGTAVCVDHHRNIKPTFHDVSLPIDFKKEQQVVEPPVYGILNGQTCSKFLLSPENPNDTHFLSHADGSLHVAVYTPFDNNNYCLEYFNNGMVVEMFTFVCFRPLLQAKFQYYAVGLSISCIFLTITIIVYGCLPKLLNLHGKTLVCYVASLLGGCIALAVVQFQTETKLSHCHLIGYFIFYCFISAFCWQSIMCFDIWWTFGSMRASRGMRKTKEWRRFIFYSIYAYGTPLIFTTITALVDYYELVPEIWRPQIGAKNTCFIARDNWRGNFIYFLAPSGLHILTNAILFLLTAIHCSKVRNDIYRMQSQTDNESQNIKKRFIADKAKYTMNVKLFIVMGVSWIMEILATIIRQPEELWYLSDTFNILQGVLVFFIFVFKRKVWHSIKQKLGLMPKTSPRGTTNATGTTLLSASNSKEGVSLYSAKYGKLAKSTSNSAIASSTQQISANPRKNI